jgi:hypothetical protein
MTIFILTKRSKLFMKLIKSLSSIFLISAFVGCSTSDPTPAANCLKDALKATSTKVQDSPSQHIILLDFDVKNSGTVDYDIQKGSAAIYIEMTVTTTDSQTYKSEQILTVTSLKAGATSAISQYAEYGATKTYKSFAFQLTCK